MGFLIRCAFFDTAVFTVLGSYIPVELPDCLLRSSIMVSYSDFKTPRIKSERIIMEQNTVASKTLYRNSSAGPMG